MTPLPGTLVQFRADLEAAIGREQDTRLRAGSRRRVTVAFAVAAVVAAVGAAAFGAVRYFVLDGGFIGLPPDGATPSSPESGELVLSAYGVGEPSRNKLWVYADGRMIWQREFVGPIDLPPLKSDVPKGANEISTGYLEQRLTPEGVELLRSEVVSTGLFGHDRELKVDDQPCLSWLHVREGAELVGVTWHGSQCPGVEHTPAATAEQARTLLRLVWRITEPESWLPAEAWEDRKIHAYVPSRFAIVFAGHSVATSFPRLALLPPPAADLLRSKAWAQLEGKAVMAGVPYAEVTTAEARALAAALDDAGLERIGDDFKLAFRIDAQEPDDRVSLWFEPIFPHGEWICSSCG